MQVWRDEPSINQSTYKKLTMKIHLEVAKTHLAMIVT